MARHGSGARVLAAPVLLLLATVPLAMDPWGWDRFGPAKLLWAVVLIGVVLGFGALKRGLRVHRAGALAWGGVLMATTLATVGAPDPLSSLIGEGSRIFGLLAAVIGLLAFVAGSSAEVSPRQVARWLVAGSIPVAAIALLQVAGLDILGAAPGIDATRARSTFGNAAFLGGYLTLVVPVALALLLDGEEDRRWRFAHALAVPLAAAGLTGTGTRGAWIAGVAGIAGVVWVLRTRLRGAAVAVPVLLGAAGVFLVLLATPGGGRIRPGVDATAGGRLDTWWLSFQVIGERPLLGWGPEGFRLAFPTVVTPDWVRSYGLERIPDRAHNLFLDTAAATGLVGLLALAVLIAVIARAVLRHPLLRSPPVLGIAAGCGSYLLHTQVLFETLEGSVILWVLLGVLVASQAARVPMRRWVVGSASGVGLALVVFGAMSVAADRKVARAVTTELPSAAVERIAEAVRLRPRTVDHYMLATSIAVNTGDEDALHKAQSLLEGWDDPDVLLAGAEVQAALGVASKDREELERAVTDFRRALGGQPYAGRAWLGLGETLLRLGRGEEAREALLAAADLLPRSVYPHAHLAMLALTEGDLGSARLHLEEARRIDSAHPAVKDLEGRL